MFEKKRQLLSGFKSIAHMPRHLAWLAPVFAVIGFAGHAQADNTIYFQTNNYTLTAPAGITSFVISGLPEEASLNQVAGSGSGPGTSGNSHALLWKQDGSVTDMNPAGYQASTLEGTNGSLQVGFANQPGGFNHAVLWANTAASFVDIHPTVLTGYTTSFAYATSSSQQVGIASGPVTVGNSHAMIWNSNATLAADLHPTNLTGYTQSTAWNVKGDNAVGFGVGTVPTGGSDHALLWTGGANIATDSGTAVDLNPAGHSNSQAYGTSADGTIQVGYSTTGAGPKHATMWGGTAASFVDLNPSGITTSVAFDTNGVQEVGFGNGPGTGNKNHAFLWNGLATGVVDLNSVLPAGEQSIAQTIDAAGNVYGTATDTLGHTFNIEWLAVDQVPEPASLSLIGLAGIGLMQRRRRTPAKLRVA